MADAPAQDPMRALAGKRWPAPEWHFEKIEAEMQSPDSKARMLGVIQRMAQQQAPDFSSLDWDAELARFDGSEFPQYYRQPFHSVPGGYLSEAAALGDRAAMEAIYQDDHPRRSLGIRDALAALIPEDARRIWDLGAGTGDGAAAIARRLPEAEVTALEASPFMLIAGRVQNAGVPNLRFQQGFAERTGLDDDALDAVNITLVFHECPDAVKREILRECRRILRPGGTLVLSDTAPDELHTYRGFYEPYKDQWSRFVPEAFLHEAGFPHIQSPNPAPPLAVWLAS